MVRQTVKLEDAERPNKSVAVDPALSYCLWIQVSARRATELCVRQRSKGGSMRIRRVYIKKAGGEIASEPCYSAWRGFSYLGYPLDFFEWDDLSQKCLRLDRRTLVVGGTVAVHMALRQIGVEVPEPLNLPQPLMRFAGRRVWETTLAAIRNENKSGFLAAVFAKPLHKTKAFAGCLLSGSADLERLQHLADEFDLQVAEPVVFIAEWRYYIHCGAVVGIAHYKGEWSQVPNSRPCA